MLARQAGGSRRSLLTDTSAASFHPDIIQESESQYGDSARAVQSTTAGWRGAGPAPAPSGSRPGVRGRANRGHRSGVPLAPSLVWDTHPIGPAFQRLDRPAFPRWPGLHGAPSPSQRRAGPPGSLKAACRSAGRLFVFSWRLCGLRLSAYDQGLPFLYRSTNGLLHPRRLLPARPSSGHLGQL